MTRQEKITHIGKTVASVFSEHTKNHMSYFIIPIPQNLFNTYNPKEVLTDFEALGWTLKNAQEELTIRGNTPSADKEQRIFPNDPTNMNAIKSYIYGQMLPTFTYKRDKKDKDFCNFLRDSNNLMFQKEDLEKKWKVHNSQTTSSMSIELDGIDLWIFNRDLSFFTIRTKQALDDDTTLTEISSSFNRILREFQKAYVDEVNHTFSNNKEMGISIVEWLLKLTTKEKADKSLLNIQENDLINSIIYTNSYYAKMITAVHLDIDNKFEKDILSTTESDIDSRNVASVDSMQELPFLLGSTSELYPSPTWENNEQYIYDQINFSGINIWKNWSGIAMKDAMAFFAMGEGGQNIVNQARHGYYFIYMLNLYINYSLRSFEHKLIDKEFVDIENIYPLYVEQQRLRNQFMSVEIATKFQPNIIHNAISKAMQTDDIYNEIKTNIDTTLSLTQKNTDMMITAVVSIFTFSGIWISQDKLLTLISQYPLLSAGVLAIILISAIFLIVNRSKVIRQSKRLRKIISKKIEVIFE